MTLGRIPLAWAILHSLAAAAFAQSGGGYDLSWSTIDGGGARHEAAGHSLHGTAGQPDSNTQAGGPYVLHGGFWVRGAAAVTPTPTMTPTGSATATPTRSATATATTSYVPTDTVTPSPSSTPTNVEVASPTPTRTSSASRSATATPTGSPSPTPTATPSPSPTQATQTPLTVCTGDCDQDGVVTVDELILATNIALGRFDVSACAACDPDGSGWPSIGELVKGVTHALTSCVD